MKRLQIVRNFAFKSLKTQKQYFFWKKKNPEEYYKKAEDALKSLDISEAFTNFKIAADNGSKPAAEWIANAYMLGIKEKGMSPDKKKALKYFDMALDENDTSTFSRIGRIKLKYDPKAAIHIFEQGAKLKDLGCIEMMGIQYTQGKHVPKDIEKSKAYFAEAAILHPSGNDLLGHLYFLEKNFEKAEEHFKKALESNYLRSNFGLGKINYAKGNYEKAKEHYDIGAKIKDEFSIYELGKMYLDGIYVRKDFLMAERLLEEAYMLGQKKAALLLSLVLSLGVHCLPNYDKSFAIYSKIATEGSLRGATRMAFFTYTGLVGEKKDPGYAVRLLINVEKKDKEAALHFGILHETENGISVPSQLTSRNRFKQGVKDNVRMAYFLYGLSLENQKYFKDVKTAEENYKKFFEVATLYDLFTLKIALEKCAKKNQYFIDKAKILTEEFEKRKKDEKFTNSNALEQSL